MVEELAGDMPRCYFIHVGPSILPRQRHGMPMTLAEAMCRAHALPYAVVYRLDENGKPVPVVGAAGSQELIHVPSGRRVRREKIDWHAALSEAELVRHPKAGLVEFRFGDEPWWTSERRMRLLAAVKAAGFGVRVR